MDGADCHFFEVWAKFDTTERQLWFDLSNVEQILDMTISAQVADGHLRRIDNGDNCNWMAIDEEGVTKAILRQGASSSKPVKYDLSIVMPAVGERLHYYKPVSRGAGDHDCVYIFSTAALWTHRIVKIGAVAEPAHVEMRLDHLNRDIICAESEDNADEWFRVQKTESTLRRDTYDTVRGLFKSPCRIRARYIFLMNLINMSNEYIDYIKY